MQPDRSPAWTRAYSFGFAAALVVLSLALVGAAAAAQPEDRDRFIGMAVFVGAFAVAAVLLVWGVERRRRAPDDDT